MFNLRYALFECISSTTLFVYIFVRRNSARFHLRGETLLFFVNFGYGVDLFSQICGQNMDFVSHNYLNKI